MPTITLTPDARAVALRQIRKAQEALGTLAAVIASAGTRSFDSELPVNTLKVAEGEMADLCETLGIETDTSLEREERYAMLRQANMRVRELEAQLGNSQGADVTQASIKSLHDRIDGWWDVEGFGHINDISFQKYGCAVNFSCSLFGDFRGSESATPLTDKERRALWHDSLRERGFVLTQDDRDWVIEDCDTSRKTLLELFAQRLPSARVIKIENFHRDRAGAFVLHGVEVFISKLDDILELPVKPSK